ncbi:hypothetical protein ACFSVJ_09185 [Prauserella oleivorans]
MTISTRWAPSCARSQPISSTAPAPNFSGVAPQVKTVSVRYSVIVVLLATARHQLRPSARAQRGTVSTRRQPQRRAGIGPE